MAEFIDVPPWVVAAIEDVADQPPAQPLLVSGTREIANGNLPGSQNPDDFVEDSADWVISISTGIAIPVRGFGLIGRDPAPRRGETVEHSIAVGNGERSVSKTHLAFGLENGQFWVEDRNSTNGTAVVSAAGEATMCEPGRRTVVGARERIHFGKLSLTITRQGTAHPK